MPMDAVLLSVGVESSGVDKGTQSLRGLEEQARRTEEATARLGSTQEETSEKVNDLAGSMDKIRSSMASSLSDNERWLQSETNKASALGKTYEQLLEQEGALRNLTKTQQESLNAIIRYREQYEELQKAQSATGESFKKGGAEVALFGVAIGSASELVRRFIDVLVNLVKAYAQWEDNQSKLNAMLEIQGPAVERSSAQINKMIVGMRELGSQSEASLLNASNALLKFSGMTGSTFDKALQASANLAALMGTDVTQAAEMVGRALENSYGVSMMRRIGLMTDAQVEYLRALKESAGDQAYQTQLLEMLAQKAGDLDAKLAKDGLAGAWAQLTNEIAHDITAMTSWIVYATHLEEALRGLTAQLIEIRKNPLSAAFSPSEIKLLEHIYDLMVVINPLFRSAAEGRVAAAKAAEQEEIAQAKNNYRMAEAAERSRQEAAAKKEMLEARTKEMAQLTDADKKVQASIANARTEAEWQAVIKQNMDNNAASKAALIAKYGSEEAAINALAAAMVKQTSAGATNLQLTNQLNSLYPKTLSLEEQRAYWTEQFTKSLIKEGDAAFQAIDKYGSYQKALEAYINAHVTVSKQRDTENQDINRQVAAWDRLDGLLNTTTNTYKKYGDALAALNVLELEEGQRKQMLADIEERLNPERQKARELAEQTAKDTLDAISAYEQSTGAIEKQAEGLERQAKQTGLTKEQLRALQIQEIDTAIATAQHNLELQKLNDNLGSSAGVSAIQNRIDALQKQRAALQDLGSAEVLAGDKKFTESVQEQTKRLQEHTAMVGKTKEQIIAMKEAETDKNIAFLEGIKATLGNTEADKKRREELEKGIAALRELKGAQEEAANTEAAEEFNRAWAGAFDDLTRRGEDFLVDFYHNGSNAWKNLWDDFVEMALKAFARILMQKLVIPIIAQIFPSLQGGAQMALGGGGGGIMDLFTGGQGGGGFNLLDSSSWSNIFKPPNWYNSFAQTGIGQAMGLWSPATSFMTAGGIGGLFGGTAAGAAGMSYAGGLAGELLAPSTIPWITGGAGAATGGLTGLGSILGGAAAVAPLALMALPFLGGLFESEPSQVRGRFGVRTGTTGFEDNAYTASRYGNLGFLDADTMYFSGAAAQEFNKIIKSALDAFDARFSKEQSDHFATVLQGMIFDSFEGTYTTEDFIKKYGANITRQVVEAAFTELGNASLAAAMQGFQSEDVTEIVNFVNSLLLIYDATKDLTEADRKLVEAMIGVTQESATLALTFANAFKTIHDIQERQNTALNPARNPVNPAYQGPMARILAGEYGTKEDKGSLGEDVIAALQGTSPSQTFFDAAKGLRELTNSFTGTLEETQALTAATEAYYAAEVQLLAQIEAVKQGVEAMFQDTIRGMTLQTMTAQQQYNFLQNEAAQLYAQLQKETDPAKIQQLAQKINADIQAAFGLLSPDQQKAMLGQFTERVNIVNQFVQDHLTDISNTIQESAGDMFKDVYDKLSGVAASLATSADKTEGAADKMDKAGDKMVTAANTPIVLVDQYGNPMPTAPAEV